MKFVSTRGQTEALDFSEAVAVGLAPDGGLFLPQKLPDLTPHLAKWEGLGYADLAFEFLRLFATDLEPAVLRDIVQRTYGTFAPAETIAPLRKLDDKLYVLELFHGQTLAFKHFALQLLGSGLRVTVLETRASKSRPEMGIVRIRYEMMNAHGECVMTMVTPAMFGRRNPGAPS